jgi:CheY-like chemotaxis protein
MYTRFIRQAIEWFYKTTRGVCLQDRPCHKVSGMKRRILIVDDDSDFTTILCERLEASGYETISAKNGLAAIRLLNNGQPNPPVTGILLDVQMPVMNGLQTLRHLQERFAHIPVIMMSAVSQPVIIEESLRLGAAAFMRKSEPSSKCLARCKQVFGHDEDQVAGEETSSSNR